MDLKIRNKAIKININIQTPRDIGTLTDISILFHFVTP